MTDAPPLIEMRGVMKEHGALRPLRVASFSAAQGERWVLSGLDQAAAETFMHLISGAAVPDEGSVRVAGADTREIATDTEWLLSLDQFGLVTHRAVLLETLGVAANLAIPMTLAVDPMPADVRAHVESLADEVELTRDRLDAKVSSIDALDRTRLHLGRALAGQPRLLLLEHPTAGLADDGQREAFGRALRRISDRRGVGWIAVSEDDVFARAAGGRHERLQPATGRLVAARSWWRWK